MVSDELFRRYLEIGASMLGMSRERAEGIVRDLVASGELARSQAAKAADWLVERSRAGTEELAEIVRREIRAQVTAMGLATRDDVTRLEAELAEVRAAAAAAGAAAAAKPAEPAAAPKAAPKRAAAAAKATATAAPAAKSTAGVQTKRAATAKKAATSAGVTKSAGIRRSASVRSLPPKD